MKAYRQRYVLLDPGTCYSAAYMTSDSRPKAEKWHWQLLARVKGTAQW